MTFKKGRDRGQLLLFPESIDEYVSNDSPVRFIDAFVEKLDLAQLQHWQSVKWLTGRLNASSVSIVGTTDFMSPAEGRCR